MGKGRKNNELLLINLEKFSKTIELDLDKIIVNLEKICNKRVFYVFSTEDNKEIKGSFPIISSFFIENKNLFLSLSKEICLSYGSNNFFSLINIKGFLSFQYQHSHTLFLYILNTIKEESEGYISLTLDTFKNLLEIENIYERFYDLERKLIIPVIDDLNKYSNFIFSFEKEKKSPSKTSKIINIKIKYINKNLKEIKNQTNFLISLVKNNIKDFSYFYDILYNTLKNYNYDYVYKTLSFLLKKYNNEKIDKYLEKSIEENWLENHSLDTKELIKLEREIQSGNMLYNELVDIFKKMKIEFLTEDANFNSSFYRNLFALKDGNIHRLSYESTKFIINIDVLFFLNKKSQIKIEKIMNE